MNIDKKKIVDYIMMEGLNVDVEEVLSREDVEKIVEGINSYEKLEDVLMNRFEMDSICSFGEVLDKLMK